MHTGAENEWFRADTAAPVHSVRSKSLPHNSLLAHRPCALACSKATRAHVLTNGCAAQWR